jgi:hypothetical protein
MECSFCGIEPAEPETLRPVFEVIERDGEKVLADEPDAACEDCYADVSEPERQWRLANECPTCWAHPCRCSA